MQPVGPGDHGTSQQDRNHQQDETAAGSRAALAKAEPALEPVEQFIQQEQLQDGGQTALSISHASSSKMANFLILFQGPDSARTVLFYICILHEFHLLEAGWGDSHGSEIHASQVPEFEVIEFSPRHILDSGTR
jgi:hypothetical protein